MRNPERVLNGLSDHSKLLDYRFERLYRVLFNKEMFHVAYQHIYAKTGNMIKGSDVQTIDSKSLFRIEKLIGTLKDETYQPNQAKSIYIPVENGKIRPQGIPSFDDKLVQEVIRMILEAIYEKQFENSSHGFRPHKSCHTALIQIQDTFIATKWFVEGDIKSFFENINHDILIEILKERISDERLLRLIRKFLKAGYIEDWKFQNTYSGTPQGGIISPLLANIYLDKLDKYVKEYIAGFDEGKVRKPNLGYKLQTKKKAKLLYKFGLVKDATQKEQRIRKLKEIDSVRSLLSNTDEMDGDYKGLKYIRYADDFIIGVIGSKEDAQQIKEDIKSFLDDKLKLELSDEKTLITHANSRAKFLGYEIYVRKSPSGVKKKKISRVVSRVYGKKVVLYLPIETMRKRLADYGALEIIQHNGQSKWKPLSRPKLVNYNDLKILDAYNTEIKGFANYYSIANNSPSLNNFRYIMKYSMYKTFARKYSMSVRRVIDKFRYNKDFAVRYTNKKGENKMRVFFNASFKRKVELTGTSGDIIPSTIMLNSSTSIIDRLKAK